VSAANVDRHATLHRQAITDELTGLSNHRRLQEVLGEAVDAYQRTKAPASLVLLDLDDFKLVNDTHGHQTGDMVLRAVADCLRGHCRTADAPARYGGEELALVLADTDAEEAAQLAERVRAGVASLALCDPAGRPLPVTVSVGVAGLGDTVATKAALIAAADAALYAAKAAGKNRVHTAASQASDVSPPAGRGAAPGSELAAQLRRAVAREELELHYQPKVTLADGRVIGVEALLRWHHPERGTLRPSAFLDVPGAAEAAPEVARWTLSRALQQAVAWRRGGRHLPVAVNISAHDLADRELPQAIARLLAEHGAEPGDLRLEITEHGVIADTARAEAALAAIRRLGVGISLDDFGTGHSSLTRLRDLPVDELKLDRGFLRATAADADVAVIRAAVSLGRDLNLTVVAEGIEDPRQWHLLRAMGCDVAQGYFVAPGLRPHELERWLVEWRPQLVH
jgi:diguanylate cyclase (GGDEF)-like protein